MQILLLHLSKEKALVKAEGRQKLLIIFIIPQPFQSRTKFFF